MMTATTPYPDYDPLATSLTPSQSAALLASHADMVWSIALNLAARNPGVSLEDIHGHVQVGFVRAASKFNPSKGWKFSTYAYRAGWREGVIYCRGEHARGFHVPANHPFWKCPAMIGTESRNEEYEEFLQVEDYRGGCGQSHDSLSLPEDFWARVTEELMPRDAYVVVQIYRDGRNMPELANELGVSKQRVLEIRDRAIHRMQQRAAKLKRYLELDMEAA